MPYKGVAHTILGTIGEGRRAHHYRCNNQAGSFSGRCGSLLVSHIWTVKDCAGHELRHFTGTSRFDAGRRLVPTHYDAFRLHVSQSYREMFDRELTKVLSEKRWQIIRKRTKTRCTNITNR